MTDLICRKTMQRCQHPGMCSPHGGCQPEKSEWQSGYDEGRRMGSKVALDERGQLKAENESLRKDAERYRWLRNPERSAAELDSVFDSYGLPMDEKIDAAMVKAKNEGHGHVFPRPDGVRARCGGPGLCKVCSADLARKEAGQ